MRLRSWYPRSFSKLLFVGFALVAVPLLIALVNNAISIDRLGTLSEKAVYQAVQATQGSRKVAELVPAMERTANQMAILGDPSLLETYRSHRKQLMATAAELANLPFDDEQRNALNEIMQQEAVIYALLSKPEPRPEDLNPALQAFSALAQRAQGINRRSNELIDREVGNLRATAREAQRVTLVQLLALFPVVIFLVAGFTYLTTRPIRQIDDAIRGIGQGNFAAPIEVGGPEDLQHLGARLDWMRRRLSELEEQKTRFLREMSHELKTPLTALRQGAELLADELVGKLTPEQREIAEILRRNSIELQKLIEDLLNYGASQFHRTSLEIAPVELRRVMSRVLDDHKLALRAKNLKLDSRVGDLKLNADTEKLRVMLDNLLSNAVKFSPNGGTIAVSGRREVDSIEIDVTDQGPGIPVEERDRVFEPFYRGRSASGALVKGTGIGLSVVREYAQMHGGTVQVVGEPPGTRLRLSLPCNPAPSKPAQPQEGAQELAS